VYKKLWIIEKYLYCPMLLQVIFCFCSYVWAEKLIRGVLLCISPSTAGTEALGSPSIFTGVSSVSTRDCKGPGHSGSGVFIAKVADEGDRSQETPQQSM
jgi:hypothetical protein